MKGVFTACVTPFDERLEIDESGFRENLRTQIEEGVDGVVILGTTAESPTLSEEEQQILISIAREETDGKIPLWVGTGSNCTKTAIKKTLNAEKLGCDGALIVAPYYNKPSQDGLYKHFEAISKASPSFPIMLYNIQGRTGVNMSVETVRKLAELPGIIGIKEASGNLSQMCDIIESVSKDRPEFRVMSGDDNLTLPLIALGGAGVVSVVSNVIPAKMKKLVDLALSGSFKEARELHYELLPLFKAAFIETNPVPIKSFMNKAGMKAGSVRAPLTPLSPENEQKIEEYLCLLEIPISQSCNRDIYSRK